MKSVIKRTTLQSTALVTLFALLIQGQQTYDSEQKLVHNYIDKLHQESIHEYVERRLQAPLINIDLQFTQSPYIYTANFTFGSNKQQARLRFTSDSDWTMITGADCYRCISRMYNRSTSTTSKDGTMYRPENEMTQLRYAGTTVKDRVCVGSQGTPCVDDFEFFVISNDSFTRNTLQRTGGVMGLAPDNDDNGPSYLTSLRALGLINDLKVSMRMTSMNAGVSKITFGGYDPKNMLPFPSAANPSFSWYDNVHDEVEWGLEMRDFLIDGYSVDSGWLTYAKVDSFMPFIQLPPEHYNNFARYMRANHTEMQCTDTFIGFGICRATNVTCEAIIHNYKNITIRFNDTNAFVIPPTSYLKTDVTTGGIPLCYNMVIGSQMGNHTVILGDVFMENYHVMYDFSNTSIGFNGYIVIDQEVVPPRPPEPRVTTNMTLIIIIVTVAAAAVAIAVATVVVIKRRNQKLQSKLTQYNKIEDTSDIDAYQKPQIVNKKGYNINE